MQPIHPPAQIAADATDQEFRAAERCHPDDEDLDNEWDAPDPETAGDESLDSDPFDDDEPLPERGDFWADPEELADDAG